MTAMPGVRAERLRWPVAIWIILWAMTRLAVDRWAVQGPLIVALAMGLGLLTVYFFYARRHALSRRVFAMLSEDERRIRATVDVLGLVVEDGGGRRFERPWARMRFAVSAPEAIYLLDEDGQIFLLPRRGIADFSPVAAVVNDRLAAGAAEARKHLNRAVTGDVVLWMLLVGLGLILTGPAPEVTPSPAPRDLPAATHRPPAAPGSGGP